MSEFSKTTVEKTNVTTYYAVTIGDIQYSVTDMYDTNSDYTKRTFLELVSQQEPSVTIQNKISEAIEDCEVNL